MMVSYSPILHKPITVTLTVQILPPSHPANRYTVIILVQSRNPSPRPNPRPPSLPPLPENTPKFTKPNKPNKHPCPSTPQYKLQYWHEEPEHLSSNLVWALRYAQTICHTNF
ncbi:hypothetical protein L873DRAFT_1504421 [Choiromyces venosus 120613-1]|uniref:Uncharacterized protein n=1 Tax=Choiromyces venosus 120613-1 TaxID=1336337 RepID=A0A3N4J5X2_9PEZI|nr:hypothetical protein L873DRAFT_1504421 [Choiromyces venosus 120613-1]